MMSWRLLLLATFVTLPAWPTSILADDEGPMHPVMAEQVGFNDARVMLGRVVLTTDDPTRPVDITNHTAELNEDLEFSSQDGIVTLNYRRTTKKSRLTLEVKDAHQVHILREPVDGSDTVALEFTQPVEGPLTLAIGSGEERQAWRAPSLWHLWFEHPDVCDHELQPLLKLLRPRWELGEKVARLDRTMLESGETLKVINRQAIAECIRDLSSPEYARRQEADRRLRLAGVDLLPVVQSIDTSNLDAEQNFRLRQITSALNSNDQEDTTDFVARWLSGDPQAWLVLMTRPDAETRSTAASRLSRLLGEPIDFDPNADEAIRQTQLEAVRKQVEKLWKL